MIDLDECVEWINTKAFQKICLQIPDELMQCSVQISLHLQKFTNASIFVICDTISGSCCNDKLSADHVEADAFIHFGHACLTCSNTLPTFYMFSKEMIDVNDICKAFYKKFNDLASKIILFYDTSYAHCIEEIYTRITKHYEDVIISRLDCTSNVKFTSASSDDRTKILGRCYNLPDYTLSVTYDAIFLGPNSKLLTALAMSIPVASWSYFENMKFQNYQLHACTWLKKRHFLVEKIKDAEVFGIIIASLNVTKYLEITQMMKSILTRVNKKSFIFSMGKLNPTKLANFHEIDIFVLISCPENSLFDTHEYFKPVVTPFEVELAFNITRNYSPFYSIDFNEILPGGLNHEDFESSQSSDVSLTSGKIRSLKTSQLCGEDSALTPKCFGSLLNTQFHTTHFQSRTWTGLEQKLGESDVETVVLGRDGIPINYTNEIS